jgi:signal transduction histidine kinase
MTLAVSDRGTGIPPEVQRRLFDPFFTTKPSGTGLGLSISARIVEAHGGSLAYQTAPNRGTTFFVHLPLVAQPREVPVASLPNPSVLQAT